MPLKPVLPGNLVDVPPPGGGENPFDQDLNTFDLPEFASLTVDAQLVVGATLADIGVPVGFFGGLNFNPDLYAIFLCQASTGVGKGFIIGYNNVEDRGILASVSSGGNPSQTAFHNYDGVVYALQLLLTYQYAQFTVPVLFKEYNVSSLPAANTMANAKAIVNNANSTTFHSIVAGGGSNVVPVFSDGTNWRIG